MGDATALCKGAPLGAGEGIDTLNLACQTGAISMDSFFYYGIIPNTEADTTHCMNNYADLECDSYVDVDTLKADLTSECFGQKKCSFGNIANYVMDGAPTKCTDESFMFL